DFACEPGQRPLVQITPLDVAFGEVALGNSGDEVVTLENKGDCLLTVSGVGLGDNQSPGFSCEPCDPSQFPQRLAPGRSLDVVVSFAPPAPGEAFGSLLVNTDDVT